MFALGMTGSKRCGEHVRFVLFEHRHQDWHDNSGEYKPREIVVITVDQESSVGSCYKEVSCDLIMRLHHVVPEFVVRKAKHDQVKLCKRVMSWKFVDDRCTVTTFHHCLHPILLEASR